MGKYFEDFEVGAEQVTHGRTITETDVVNFAALSGDYNPLHTDEEFMRGSQFGRRIAHGLLVLAVSHGLVFRLGILEGTVIAFLAIESLEFKAPTFFGDTVHVVIKVIDKRESKSKPDRGVVRFKMQTIKQDGTVVQEGIKTMMMKRRG